MIRWAGKEGGKDFFYEGGEGAREGSLFYHEKEESFSIKPWREGGGGGEVRLGRVSKGRPGGKHPFQQSSSVRRAGQSPRPLSRHPKKNTKKKKPKHGGCFICHERKKTAAFLYLERGGASRRLALEGEKGWR